MNDCVRSFVAAIAGAIDAVVETRRGAVLTIVRAIAGFLAIAELTVVAEPVVGDVVDDVGGFVADFVRT